MGAPQISGGGILGEKVTEDRRTLDTFALPKSNFRVKYVSDEVSSLCPITGQPDWYTVEITLHHSALGLESKALKLYLQSFREDGQFCEQFAHTIASDVIAVIKQEDGHPEVEVVVTQKPRGGVSISSRSVLS